MEERTYAALRADERVRVRRGMLREGGTGQPALQRPLRFAGFGTRHGRPEANALARRLLELEPTFRAIRFLEFAGFVKPEIREAFAVAFREAGLPE